MNKRRLTALLAFALTCSCALDPAVLEKAARVDRLPGISPDYSGIVLPPNIAPLNFRVTEPGDAFVVRFCANNSAPLVVTSRDGRIAIPQKKWRRLLECNRGNGLRIDVFARRGGDTWHRFAPIENRIAFDPIDAYLTYRTLSFLYNYSSDLRIHERHLESFRERTLLSSKNIYWACVNCHTPENNDPSRTVVHYRSNDFGSGTLITRGDSVKNIATKLGYTSWRPGGEFIAFSLSKVRQCFHAVGKNPIDDYDLSSELFIFDAVNDRILDVPELYREGTIQTWPAWSPDGRYLYYCSGPILWNDFNEVPPDRYAEQRCSLLRIAFNVADRTFGPVDTVLSSAACGRSITQPRVSPDGRFVLFCMHAFGPYPVTQPSSDLYLLETASGRFWRLDATASDESESWHGWSHNGRWIVFSSKRDGGILTRLYFAHIDSLGNASKPFVLPQKDGALYESYIRCFNVPEFAVAASPLAPRRLLRAIRSGPRINVSLPGQRTVHPIQENPGAEWASRKKSAD